MAIEPRVQLCDPLIPMGKQSAGVVEFPRQPTLASLCNLRTGDSVSTVKLVLVGSSFLRLHRVPLTERHDDDVVDARHDAKRTGEAEDNA
jgi:hypothetical protein